MPILFASLVLMDVQESTLVASGIGSMVTLLLALRKGRPLTTVLGWALAGFGAAYYFGLFVATKLGISKAGASLLTSGTAFIWAPWGTKALPKFLSKLTGVDSD